MNKTEIIFYLGGLYLWVNTKEDCWALAEVDALSASPVYKCVGWCKWLPAFHPYKKTLRKRQKASILLITGLTSAEA